MNEEQRCVDWVRRIYYANITMDSEAIRKVVEEIAEYYHRPEER